jgi:DNA-binding NarL/FixJ family response regulator
MGNKINVLLVAGNDEDKKLIFEAMTLQDDIQIVGVEKDETGAIIKSEQLKPDVLIMNLQPPGIDGTVLAPIIHRRSPDTSIIMICDRDENNYADTALKAGISGFLLRKADMDKLLSVVRIVYMDGYYVSASIIKRALDLNSYNYIKKENLRFFSPVERCIINGIAKGVPYEEIAGQINYSAGAVKNCVTAIKHKTKLKKRSEIAVFSLVHGLINSEKNDGHILNNTIE